MICLFIGQRGRWKITNGWVLMSAKAKMEIRVERKNNFFSRKTEIRAKLFSRKTEKIGQK
jgi:hypothetical protein